MGAHQVTEEEELEVKTLNAIEKLHGGSEEVNMEWTCGVCGKTSEQDLQKVERTSRGSYELRCPYCGIGSIESEEDFEEGRKWKEKLSAASKKEKARLYESQILPDLMTGDEKADLLSRMSKEYGEAVTPREAFECEVDEALRPILSHLSSEGFPSTTWSCQGGSWHESSTALFGLDGTFIESHADLDRIRRIIKEHTNVGFRISSGKGFFDSKDYMVKFLEPLGGKTW